MRKATNTAGGYPRRRCPPGRRASWPSARMKTLPRRTACVSSRLKSRISSSCVSGLVGISRYWNRLALGRLDRRSVDLTSVGGRRPVRDRRHRRGSMSSSPWPARPRAGRLRRFRRPLRIAADRRVLRTGGDIRRPGFALRLDRPLQRHLRRDRRAHGPQDPSLVGRLCSGSSRSCSLSGPRDTSRARPFCSSPGSAPLPSSAASWRSSRPSAYAARLRKVLEPASLGIVARRWTAQRSPSVRPARRHAVSLYLLLPSLVAVFGSWRDLFELEPLWFAIALGFEALSFLAAWACRGSRLAPPSWFTVGTSHLAASAFGRIVPGEWRRLGGRSSTGCSCAPAFLRDAWGRRSPRPRGSSSPLCSPCWLCRRSPPQAPSSIACRTPVAGAVFALMLLAAPPARSTSRSSSRRAPEWCFRLVRRPRSAAVAKLVASRSATSRRTLGERWKMAVPPAAVGKSLFDYLALVATLRGRCTSRPRSRVARVCRGVAPRHDPPSRPAGSGSSKRV